MTTTATVKTPKHKSVILFARAIEASVDGEAPEAARLWRAGWNKTDKGDLNFTPRSAKLVMKAFADRANPLVWYYEHEDRIPLEERGGAPMKGVCSAPSSVLTIRQDESGQPELWAEQIAWTDEAKRQIRTGERRQLSPIAAFDSDTREIVEILNVSLCAEGATHHGTLLASAGRDSGMDDLLAALMSAIENKDWEACETLVQQLEAMDNGEAAVAAKMGRAAMKAGKDADPPPPPPAASTTKIAAGRAPSASVPAYDVAAFNRAMGEMQAATRQAQDAAKRSDKATVVTLIAANRDLFDTVDEREHVAAANPEATTRHINSMRRKATAGILVASKTTDTKTVDPPPDGTNKKPEDELTLPERLSMDQFNRGKPPEKQITAAEFLASKRKHEMPAKPTAKGGVA